jgi:hypothetical protein
MTRTSRTLLSAVLLLAVLVPAASAAPTLLTPAVDERVTNPRPVFTWSHGTATEECDPVFSRASSVDAVARLSSDPRMESPSEGSKTTFQASPTSVAFAAGEWWWQLQCKDWGDFTSDVIITNTTPRRFVAAGFVRRAGARVIGRYLSHAGRCKRCVAVRIGMRTNEQRVRVTTVVRKGNRVVGRRTGVTRTSDYDLDRQREGSEFYVPLSAAVRSGDRVRVRIDLRGFHGGRAVVTRTVTVAW